MFCLLGHRGFSQQLRWRARKVRALLWPLFARSAWLQKATVVAGRPQNWLPVPTPKTEHSPQQRTHLSCPPPQLLAEPTPKMRPRATLAPSTDVPATTVAGSDHANQANRGQTSAFTCRARQLIGYLSPRRPRAKRPEKRPPVTCQPSQWLAEPTSTKRTEATSEPSPVVPASSVAARANANRSNRGLSNALNCYVRLHCCCLCPRCPRQRPDLRHHVSCPPTQWLSEPTQTKRTQGRAAHSPVVATTTVAG